MDINTLLPTDTTVDDSFFGITGPDVSLQSQSAPLYKVPGFSVKQLSILELVSKPFKVKDVKIDVNYPGDVIDINPEFILRSQFTKDLVKYFLYPQFDVEFMFKLPGHQFAIGLIGMYFNPIPDDIRLRYYANSTAADNIAYRYNIVMTMSGSFIKYSPASSTTFTRCILPMAAPYPEIVQAEDVDNVRSITYGQFNIFPILDLNASEAVTSITGRLYCRLINLRFLPWNY